jgi:nucleoporin POM152
MLEVCYATTLTFKGGRSFVYSRKGTSPKNSANNSTAKINPSGKSFCLHPKQKSHLVIPIRLNGTTPILIQYSHTTFSDPPVVRNHDIIAKPLRSMIEHAEGSEEPGEEGLQILPFHVTEIGAYKIERVVDKTSSDVRIYHSEAIVVECPTAEISSFNELEGDFCQGETDALKVHVRGVPPLHITYTQIVNGHPLTIPIDSIHPETFTSPLLNSDANQQVIRPSDYSFAQAHPITLTYPLSLDTIGVWQYVLRDVRDALGNTVDFEDSPPGYSITVHETPKVSLRGCSEDSPIKVLKGRDTNLNFNVQTLEAGPFNITLAYTPPDASEPTSIEIHKLSHKRDSLSVTEPGLYSIHGITTRYCSGDVLTPQTCLVITPPEPSLQIEWSTLRDHCSGTVGVTADLTFIGEPPFHLSYRTLSKATNHHEVKRMKVDRTRHQMDFKPEVAGTYSYEFIALDDVNYRWIELDGDMYNHEATVHPLPGVKFLDIEPRKTCIGSNLDVPVRMIGSGPWNLTYDIAEGGSRRQSFTTRVEHSETVLQLPKFQKGGKATVSLRSVTDASGCKVQLGEDDLVIDVRRDKPSAKFYTTSVTGRDGDKIKMPLRLTGDGPWLLKYSHEDTHGHRSEREVFVSDPNGFIETRSDGVFELLSVQDSSCPGVVKSGSERFQVKWIARPKVDLVGFEGTPQRGLHKREDICAGLDAFLDITLHGTKFVNFF